MAINVSSCTPSRQDRVWRCKSSHM